MLVVVSLEKIDIGNDHRQRATAALGPRPLPREHFIEAAPIGKLGELIGSSQFADTLIGRFKLGIDSEQCALTPCSIASCPHQPSAEEETERRGKSKRSQQRRFPASIRKQQPADCRRRDCRSQGQQPGTNASVSSRHLIASPA